MTSMRLFSPSKSGQSNTKSEPTNNTVDKKLLQAMVVTNINNLMLDESNASQGNLKFALSMVHAEVTRLLSEMATTAKTKSNNDTAQYDNNSKLDM